VAGAGSRWQRSPGGSTERPWWHRLRTAGLKEKLRQQVQGGDLEEVLRLAETAAGRERLKALLERLAPAANAP
jgi:hypothetical protein